MNLKSVCVYCGSSPGLLPAYVATAQAVGRRLAVEGIRLVYGGGNVGLMGALADAALAGGGEVVGVIPENLFAKEVAHTGLTKLHRVRSMHERKALMAELADAFVALPGGVGTMEEIFEMITWTQIGVQSKSCAFLDVAGFYAPLFTFLNQMTEHRFLRPEQRNAVIIGTDLDDVLVRLRNHTPVTVDKWLDRKPGN
jgi:uncharacterized protein (TIGR00730 family)